jgi:predicted metal-dependent hydrolase
LPRPCAKKMPSPQIIRSKRKTIALVVQSNGELLIRAPQRATLKQINAMLSKHADWIAKKQAQAKTAQAAFTPREFVKGEKFLFLGENYAFELTNTKKPTLTLNGRFQLAQTIQGEAKKHFEKWYKKEARTIFNERVAYYATKNGFDVKKVKLSSARTRWGSCSAKGYINLTWRLVMAPLEIIDYVVVHELCHLREANHSKAYWAQVVAIMPDYKSRRKWLKENGRDLHWE